MNTVPDVRPVGSEVVVAADGERSVRTAPARPDPLRDLRAEVESERQHALNEYDRTGDPYDTGCATAFDHVLSLIDAAAAPPEAPEPDPAVWSNASVNGERQTWRQLYEHENERATCLNRWAVMVSDLDRCEHGRHEVDVCSSCGGPSVGNPLLPEGTVLGHNIDGTPYVVPSRSFRSRIDVWRAPSPAPEPQP